jgi:hypothetical protein
MNTYLSRHLIVLLLLLTAITGSSYAQDQEGQASLPCTLGEGGLKADCKCYSYQDGKEWNYVSIGSILNEEVREKTMSDSECGPTGASCINLSNQAKCELSGNVGSGNCKFAPVCKRLGTVGGKLSGQTLYPDLPRDYSISTFSFKHATSYPIGSTPCEAGLYAGCMTAPCQVDEDGEFSNCTCPTYNGVFQIGQTLDSKACDLQKETNGKHVWSAANVDISD